MNASEARLLSNQNAMTYDSIIELIKSSANRGLDMVSVPKIKTGLMIRLINDGYTLSEHIDPFNNLKHTIIEW